MEENKQVADLKQAGETIRKEKRAEEITKEFLARREERRSIENGWTLNINFFSGNQYCDVSPFGDVVEEDKRFYWQSRRVFNHIAPTVDCRIAKLEKMKPDLRVRAFSDEDGDLKAAKLATGVLQYVQERINLKEVLSKAMVWSETCGSVFYKVLWNEKGGRQVAVDESDAPIYEGETQVCIAPPYEIFPDRLDAEDFEGVFSMIHAQAVSAEYVRERFGEVVEGKPISGLMGYSQPSAGKLPLQQSGMKDAKVADGVILLERYEKPSGEYPEGRLEIVADNKLLYEGPLPYKNGERGERTFPFVKQDCLRLPGSICPWHPQG